MILMEGASPAEEWPQVWLSGGESGFYPSCPRLILMDLVLLLPSAAEATPGRPRAAGAAEPVLLLLLLRQAPHTLTPGGG